MAIEIDYYITMVSKNNELVNLKGSSVNLPAHGWCGARARKNNAAKNSVRPRKNTAEGGCGGNSAVFLQKIEASPATLQFIARHHRKILFSLGEKEIGRAQNEKSKEYFSVVWRAERAVAGLASLVWFRSAVFDKIGSSQTVKTQRRWQAGSAGLQSPDKSGFESPWRRNLK